MNKHTKGPWSWVGDRLEAPGEDVLGVDDDGKEFGMHSAILVESEDSERALANRSLIASAPELLDALVDILVGMEASGGWDGDDELFDAGIAACKKATGENS